MTRYSPITSATVRKIIIAELPQAPQQRLTTQTRVNSQANPCVEAVEM